MIDPVFIPFDMSGSMSETPVEKPNFFTMMRATSLPVYTHLPLIEDLLREFPAHCIIFTDGEVAKS